MSPLSADTALIPDTQDGTYLFGCIHGPGVNFGTSWTITPKHHCGEKGSVSRGLARSLDANQSAVKALLQKTPAPGLWLENTVRNLNNGRLWPPPWLTQTPHCGKQSLATLIIGVWVRGPVFCSADHSACITGRRADFCACVTLLDRVSVSLRLLPHCHIAQAPVQVSGQIYTEGGRCFKNQQANQEVLHTPTD